MHTLPPLAYDYDALQPHISAATLKLHHGVHHRGYLDKLNTLVSGSALEGAPLDAIIRQAPRPSPLFNNAAQAWNHAFFWNSLRPPVPGGGPLGALRDRMDVDFGGVEGFAAAFKEAAAGVFGSGWAWLVREGDALSIVTTGNADTPILHGQLPLLVLDVWEHSYYLDYQSRRPAYVSAVVDHLLNWEFAELNFEGELALHA
jgi:Fe-Mn family superoxide dismutase